MSQKVQGLSVLFGRVVWITILAIETPSAVKTVPMYVVQMSIILFVWSSSVNTYNISMTCLTLESDIKDW